MRRALIVLPFLTTVLATAMIAGCQQAQTVGGKARPRVYRSVVSLSPSTTEILASNGVNIVGRTSADDYPAGLRVPIVGSVKPDYEALSRIKPDLIVYDAELYGDAETRKLEATGAKLYRFDPKTIAEYALQVAELGSLTATETGFSTYLDRIYSEQALAEGDEPKPRPKVAVILPDASGRHLIGGTKGLRAECVKIAGGDQIGPESDRFEPLSAEYLVAQDPDVIILAGDRAAFEKDARFKNIKARREAHVYGLPSDVVLRRGARVDKLIANLHKAFALASEPAPTAGTATGGTN